ncbi:hypothetical protein CC86DRAFT_193485 [Ophiobolus disseminans]|uniref:Uncharacterized protein n=1 Tax=Ophiobolus disseminans TaxID=1469910 RepID=A0A6A7A575_9PLEO|nr:hypothetical protein CC86DRAFT_193485 [Ophiobolus disseminans]
MESQFSRLVLRVYGFQQPNRHVHQGFYPRKARSEGSGPCSRYRKDIERSSSLVRNDSSLLTSTRNSRVTHQNLERYHSPVRGGTERGRVSLCRHGATCKEASAFYGTGDCICALVDPTVMFGPETQPQHRPDDYLMPIASLHGRGVYFLR